MELTIHIQKLKNQLFLFPYFAMILVGLMMPSDGNHGIMTPKSLSFLGSILFFSLYILIKQRATVYQLKILLCTSLMCCFLMTWLFFGLMDDPISSHSSFDQFKMFIVTLSFVVMTLYAVSESFITEEKIIRTMILANFAYSCVKLLLILLHIFQVIDLFSFMDAIDMRFMSMEMASGFSRFQTSVDIVTPFFILFVLHSDKLNLQFTNRFKYAYCVISAISIVFSFSRFLMAVACCSGVLYWLTLSGKNFLKGLSICLFLVLGFIVVIGPDNFLQMVERRFFSNDNYYSDLTRKQQIDALMEQFFKAPYFGAGLGGYVKDFIRDTGILHSYEVQWVAFLMQFGVVGIILLLIPVLMIAYQFLLKPFSKVHLSFFSLFIIWLLSGFTNPFLISLASGIVYSIFILSANILNRDQEELL